VKKKLQLMLLSPFQLNNVDKGIAVLMMQFRCMSKIKRIISDEKHQAEKKSKDDVAKKAIYISLDDDMHSKSPSSEEMKWNAVGGQLFGTALNEIETDLPKVKHDTKTNQSR
jgi:hypothetical protein